MSERERLQSVGNGRQRLLDVLEAGGHPHPIDPGVLGEYAERLVAVGRIGAGEAFPAVTAHLASGCDGCSQDLAALVALLASPDSEPPAPAETPGMPAPGAESGIHATDLDGRHDPAALEVERTQRTQDHQTGTGPWSSSATGAVSPGGHAPDPPPAVPPTSERQGRRDARDGPERSTPSTGRHHLHAIRTRLLIAAAVAIVAIGLSLIAMAYLASQRQPARFDLAPRTTAPVPGQSPREPGPAQGPSGTTSGRAVPDGMTCPASHPLKGNRGSLLYHAPGGDFYAQTRPEVCFATPADAEAAGYRRSAR